MSSLLDKISELEWQYVHNYEKILADLDVAILRWEVEQEVKEK